MLSLQKLLQSYLRINIYISNQKYALTLIHIYRICWKLRLCNSNIAIRGVSFLVVQF